MNVEPSYFHLWEFIVKEQPGMGIYFQRQEPLRNISNEKITSY